jgi:hypothetical protein
MSRKYKNALRGNHGDGAFNGAIMCTQSGLDTFNPLVARSHDGQDCFGSPRLHEMFDALRRTHNYGKGCKAKEGSPEFHGTGVVV